MPWLLAAIPLVGLLGFLLYEHAHVAAVTAPVQAPAPLPPPPPPPVTPTQVAQQAAKPKYVMIIPVRAKGPAPAPAPPPPKPAPPKAASPPSTPAPAPSGPAGGNYTLSPGAATLRGGAWFFNIPAGSTWDTGQMSGTDAYQPLFMTDQAIFDTHGTPGVWTFAWTDVTGTTQRMTVHFTT